MASIGPYEVCLSPRVTKNWGQKEINLFVSETIEFTCIVIIIINIIMSIQQDEDMWKSKEELIRNVLLWTQLMDVTVQTNQ